MSRDGAMIERGFEELLTKEQLYDLIKRRIKPDHWTDGVVSYFRVYRIIEMLREQNEPYNPNLDVAIDVLSDGKSKIRNQSHSEFCRFIRSQVEHQQSQSDEDLQEQVERLMPGCIPIGPECESLGITGDILFNGDRSFPKPIDPALITNRVIYELSQYLPRIRENHDDMARWLKKILGLRSEYVLTGETVQGWCTALHKESSRKRRQSMSQAQQYLMEKFEFPGQDLSFEAAKAVSNDPSLANSVGLSDVSEEIKKDQSPGTSELKATTDKSVENSSDVVDVDVSSGDGDDKEQGMDISGLAEDQGEESGSKENNCLVTRDSPMETNPSELAEEKHAKTCSLENDENTNNQSDATGNKEDDEEHSDIKESDCNKDEEHISSSESKVQPAVTSEAESSRAKSSRGEASAAMMKMVKKQPDKETSSQSQLSKPPANKNASRVSRSVKDSVSKSKQKPQTKRRPARKTLSRKSSSTVKESDEDKDDDDEEENDENDDKDYDGKSEEDIDSDEESSDDEEEDRLTNSLPQKSRRQTRSGTKDTGNLRKKLTEAGKVLASVNKVMTRLKKEMRIAMEYLEDETAKVCKDLKHAQKELHRAKNLLGGGHGGLGDAEDEEEEEDEGDVNTEESEDKTPLRKTRSRTTKKITVKVEPGVKSVLKKPLLKLMPFTCDNDSDESDIVADDREDVDDEAPRTTGRKPAVRPSTTSHTTRRTNAVNKEQPSVRSGARKIQSVSRRSSDRTSRQSTEAPKPGPKSRREIQKQNAAPILDFDKEKLFSSRLSVSLTKLDQDLIQGEVFNIGESSDDETLKSKNRKSWSTMAKKPADGSDVEMLSSDPGSGGEENTKSRTSRSRARSLPSRRKSRNTSSVKKETDDEDNASSEEEERPLSRGKSCRSSTPKTKDKCSEVSQEQTNDNDQDSSEEDNNSVRPSGPKRSTGTRRSQRGGEKAKSDADKREKKGGTSSRGSVKSGAKHKQKNDISDESDSDADQKLPPRKSPRSKAKESIVKIKTEKIDSSDGETASQSQALRSNRSTSKKRQPAKNGGSKPAEVGEEASEKDEKSTRRSTRSVQSLVKSSGSSDSEEDKSCKEKEKSNSSAFAASMTSQSGDWRGASSKEKVKKRSLNDFVQMLNHPKRRKVESGRKAPRQTGEKGHPKTDVPKSTEDEESHLDKEEFGDDDFLEKKIKAEIEKQKSLKRAEKESEGLQNGEGLKDGEETGEGEPAQDMDRGGDDQHADDGVVEESSHGDKEEDGKGLKSKKSGSGDIPTFEVTVEEELEGCEGSEEETSKSSKAVSEEKMDTTEDTVNKRGAEEEGHSFPEDSIVGQRIRHRCCLGAHGFYKWYDGKVIHKSSASELLTLDEEQFSHLNNLYTVYTVKYEDWDSLVPKALEVDWKKGNLKFLD